MYCGSCLRDNALASELLARGHDVVLTPVYTPTRTDERNVSQGRVLFGGISVFLEQHAPIFRHTPRIVDRLLDAEWVIRMATKRQIKVDPKSLGELTVSMLRGEQGFQRKEIDKMLEWLAIEPRFDVVNLPYTLLLGLAAPLRRALGVPICCTLQGEDLFLDGLGPPYRQQSLDLDSRREHPRRRVRSGQPLLRRLHARLSRRAGGEDAHDPRWASTPRRIRRAAALAPRGTRSPSATSPASRRRRACTRWLRATARCGRGPVSGPRAWSWPAISHPSIRATSTDVKAKMASWGLGGSVRVSRRARSRRQGRLPAQPRRVVGARDLRRAEGVVPARGDGHRGAGRAAAARRLPRDPRAHRRRAHRRTGSGRGAGRRSAGAVARPGAGARARARPAPLASAAHYTVGRMAEEAEALYSSLMTPGRLNPPC